MTRSAVVSTALVTLVMSVSRAGYAQRAEVPKGMLFGMTVPVSDIEKNPDADNIGAPRAVLAELYARTGANLTGLRYDWAECEPTDPGKGASKYVWPDRSDDPFLKIPDLHKMVSFGLGPPGWAADLEKKKVAKDPEAMARYWRLVERFVTAAARHARENYGARYFRAPGNEPSLKSCTDNPVYKPEYPNWYTWYMDAAKHVYSAVKADHRDNQVVIGALVVGDEGHVGALYAAGAKGHFDVMDIHAYGDAKTHVSMKQIMETHRTMEKHRDGHKKIFLGEGWSCFPLPKSLDGNLEKNRPYTKEEADHYRQTIQVGWMNLTTPRPGEYDPKWVLGARYFTFCDLIEGRGWRRRAVPQRDKDGNVTHYLVDGYPKRENELGPFFRPWGIVDVEGKPKGDLLESCPPYIPRYRFAATLARVGSKGTVTADREYSASITFRNLEKVEMSEVRLGIYGRGKEGKKIRFEALRNKPAAVLKPGRGISAQYKVAFPAGLRGKKVRFYGECWYTWDGKPYYADAWGPIVEVR